MGIHRENLEVWSLAKLARVELSIQAVRPQPLLVRAEEFQGRSNHLEAADRRLSRRAGEVPHDPDRTGGGAFRLADNRQIPPCGSSRKSASIPMRASHAGVA
jgi:hypothetical protein